LRGEDKKNDVVNDLLLSRAVTRERDDELQVFLSFTSLRLRKT
jgi:hypothetical protein